MNLILILKEQYYENIKKITLLLTLLLVFQLSATVDFSTSENEDLLTIKAEKDSVLKTNFIKMSNISIKLNLTQLNHVRREIKGTTGMVDCLIIPIKENGLFIGEKNVSIDLAAFELKAKRENSKTTHIIKQQLPKDLYDLLNEADRKQLPILGDAVYWGFSEPAPVASSVLPESPDNTDDTDDLPF